MRLYAAATKIAGLGLCVACTVVASGQQVHYPTPVAMASIPAAGWNEDPAICGLLNNKMLVVWGHRDSETDPGKLMARVLHRDDLSTLAPDTQSFPLCLSDSGQSNPAVATMPNGSAHVVVWEDDRHSSAGVRRQRDIYMARVGYEGASFDPAGRLLSSAPEDEVYPAVCFTASGGLLVWRRGEVIVGLRLRPSGMPLDLLPFEISTQYDGASSARPSLVTDGTGFLVAWIQTEHYETTTTVHGRTVSV